MVCEQAVRRGGFHKVTDSLWLVLAFQTWYVGDALYNEVCFVVPTSSIQLERPLARYFDYHGRHHRWVWVHAVGW